MATVDVTRLRELRSKVDEREWEVVMHGSAGCAITAGKYERVATIARLFWADYAAYIAAVHNALPDVLDALEQARGERQQVREYIKQLEAERAELRAKLSSITERAEAAEERVKEFEARLAGVMLPPVVRPSLQYDADE